MKVTTNTNQQAFIPFDINITIETLDDALTLLAILNPPYGELKRAVLSQSQIKPPNNVTNLHPIFDAISDSLSLQKIAILQ